MKHEREIAAFALPYAAGVALTSLFGLGTSLMTYAVSPVLMVALLTLSIYLFKTVCPDRKIWFIIGITGLICGLFCALSDSLSPTLQISGIQDQVRELGEGMKSCIDSIAFKNEDTSRIVKALITGDRSGLSPQTVEAFRDSGASHILALSGLHIGIIYGIVSFLLKPLGNSTGAKRLRSVSIIIFCIIYALSTGGGASIYRALLFIIIAETGRLTFRQTNLCNTLIISFLIQLIISPSSLKSIGFQLSYAAVAGIALIHPLLKRAWPDEKGGLMKWIWNSASMSISCQITTGPLAYIYFGTFPQYFLLTNLIAIPLTGLIIPVSLVVTGLTALGWCPQWAVEITEGLVRVLSWGLGIIASM